MRWKALFKLLRPYRVQVLEITGWVTAAALLESIQVVLFLPVFDSLLKGSIEGPLGWLPDAVRRIPFPVQDPLTREVTLVLAVTGVKAVVILWKDRRVAWISGTVQHELKERLLKLYAGASYAYFLDRKHGQLVYNVMTAASKTGTLVQKIAQLGAELTRATAISLLLFFASDVVMLLLAVLAIAYFLLTRAISRRVSYHTGQGRVVAGTEQNSALDEFLSGIRQIMAFGTQASWLARFDAPSRRFRDLYVKDSFWLSVPKTLLDVTFVMAIFGGLLAARQLRPDWLSEQLPLLALFVLAAMRLIPSLSQLGHLRMEVVGLLGDAEVVEEALDHPVSAPRGGGRVFPGLQKEILLKNVGFVYPGRQPVLWDVSLGLVRGRVTAVVGPSGSGKTTLAHLLLGLLEPTQGGIEVDGVSLREYSLEGWRSRIGFVSQEIFIAHGTVAENIAFGRPGFTKDQVRRAAKVARAHEFIEQLPHGYKTVVGERGMKLSGGQQQRISIARAVLADPEILIFDEATSFLDAESERHVQETIEGISRNRTVLLIAHRLSTVEKAGLIVVLDQGRVVEQGKHAELLEGRGRYYQLFKAAAPAGIHAEASR